MKDFLQVADLNKRQIMELLELAAKLKAENKQGTTHHILKGKTLAMIFAKSSTRTRVSFEVGMYQLGGHALCLNSNDLQLGRGETIYDTANVLSRYCDGVMIRTFSHAEVEELAKYASVPIINGLTDDHHPCQAMADLLTMQEAFGDITKIKLAYIGDGNNVANSLLQAAAITGMEIAIATPPAYAVCKEIVDGALTYLSESGAKVSFTNDPKEAVASADVVYTDTWISMGQDSEKQQRIAAFKGFTVDAALMKLAKPTSIFMHDLPAYRDFEVTDEVMVAPYSRIFDQAENRMHAQKAVMATLM